MQQCDRLVVLRVRGSDWILASGGWEAVIRAETVLIRE
jgi:hypothetical protein